MTRILDSTSTGFIAGFDLPPGWDSLPEEIIAEIPSRGEGKLSFSIQVCETCKPGRYVLPVRIEFNGRNLGRFREAVVDVM